MKIIKVLLVLCAVTGTQLARAQEYKVSKSTGRLEINAGKATIEGYNGSEVIFSSLNTEAKEKDERATGLRSVNGSGLEDNSGFGLNIVDKGNVLQVTQLKKTQSPDVKILVPKGMIIAVTFESQYGGEIKFKNVESEIEVSVNYNSIILDNVTGPVTIKTVYGHVEASFGSVIKDPISIVSVYGYVDVSLPQSAKASVRLSTSYGEILVAPEFKMEVEKQGEMEDFSDKVTGKINGGGLKIDLNSSYGKVYLRKK